MNATWRASRDQAAPVLGPSLPSWTAALPGWIDQIVVPSAVFE
jgi:hypothetical protein